MSSPGRSSTLHEPKVIPTLPIDPDLILSPGGSDSGVDSGRSQTPDEPENPDEPEEPPTNPPRPASTPARSSALRTCLQRWTRAARANTSAAAAAPAPGRCRWTPETSTADHWGGHSVPPPARRALPTPHPGPAKPRAATHSD